MENNNLDIVFVIPPKMGRSGFPFGVAIMSAILKEQGYGVGIVDANAYALSESQVAKEISDLQPSIVGFTGTTSNYAFLRGVSTFLRKQRPDITQIAGGWWSREVPKVILGNTCIDIVVRGEADDIITDLCASIINKSDLSLIRGLCFYDTKGDYRDTGLPPYPQNLDRLPLPAYDLFNMNYYIRAGDYWVDRFMNTSYWDKSSFYRQFGDINNWVRINVYSGRGCYGTCTFCSNAGVTRRNHSPRYVVEHIKDLNRIYGANYFRFTESLTITTKEWTKEFCRELISSGLKIVYFAQLRGDFVYDDECLELLKKSGCYMVSIGIESGSNEILGKMRKRITIEQNYNIIKALRKHKIWVVGFFILNMPGETSHTLRDTLKFVRKSRIVFEDCTYASPYPGTELYKYAMNEGCITDEHKYFMENPVYFFGLAYFQEYIKYFNYNQLSPDLLLETERKLLSMAKTNWYYEKNRVIYWCFRLFPFLAHPSFVKLLQDDINRQQMKGLGQQSLQIFRLLMKARGDIMRLILRGVKCSVS